MASMLEEEVHARPGGAPIDSFHDALAFELFHDPHFVVDVRSERVRLGDGTFGEHDHVLFFLSGFLGFGRVRSDSSRGRHGAAPTGCFRCGMTRRAATEAAATIPVPFEFPPTGRSPPTSGHRKTWVREGKGAMSGRRLMLASGAAGRACAAARAGVIPRPVAYGWPSRL
jgi:hypothetical protein